MNLNNKIIEFISTPEINFKKSLLNGFKKIKNSPKFDKYLIYFWLLGPFLYLIERTPADIWLSFIAIAFLIHSFIKNDWSWANQLWFRLVMFFWLICIISSMLSSNPTFSLGHSIVWIRFPIYAVAIQTWLAKDRDNRIIMLLSILIGFIIMCFILLSEILYNSFYLSTNYERLSWPYGDFIPGAYLAKISILIICIFFCVGLKKINKNKSILFVISIFGPLFIFFTGERMHLIICLSTVLLATILWNSKIKNLFALIILLFVIIISGILKPDFYKRFTSDFIKSIPILNFHDNEYWGAWRGGLQQGLDTPIIGVGPAMTRLTCQDLKPQKMEWLPGSNYCGNHPHNYYIQLFAETGLIGLIAGFSMFLGIIYTVYKARETNKECPMALLYFIIPIIIFFPFQQTGNFFGQWGNLFIWFCISFCIAQNQNYKKSKLGN